MRKKDTLIFKTKQNPPQQNNFHFIATLTHAPNVISVLINVLNISIFVLIVLFNNTSHTWLCSMQKANTWEFKQLFPFPSVMLIFFQRYPQLFCGTNIIFQTPQTRMIIRTSDLDNNLFNVRPLSISWSARALESGTCSSSHTTEPLYSFITSTVCPNSYFMYSPRSYLGSH